MRRFGPLAQLVEQGTLNPKVVGSIPTRPIQPPRRRCGLRDRAHARDHPKVESPEQFARFCRIVLADPALERRLQAITDWPSFVDAALGAAAEHGLALTEADVLAARKRATRSWLERWV